MQAKLFSGTWPMSILLPCFLGFFFCHPPTGQEKKRPWQTRIAERAYYHWAIHPNNQQANDVFVQWCSGGGAIEAFSFGHRLCWRDCKTATWSHVAEFSPFQLLLYPPSPSPSPRRAHTVTRQLSCRSRLHCMAKFNRLIHEAVSRRGGRGVQEREDVSLF